ncbi:MAG: dephospho-CoA kinase [Candidatus Anoxymicrobium japonicum]|uniref:Dephospho-CoA kinase n=1 Tax=Candidatus Anoxymicrobium japonicum TaxID=2013648 RepID=A0A2N3G4Q5_9ACTN|nr:MAG: dephospho-CoA kinase [Candidatus Anoxymicrobium japonicum]
MKVIAFTGMPGSGKSEAVRIVKERGLQVIRMGDMVWDEVRRRGLELKDSYVGMVATEMRRIHGPSIWAQRTAKKLAGMRTETLELDAVVIDGVRNSEEIEFFKNELGSDFRLVAIHASPKTRYERILARKRDDDDFIGEASVKNRDFRELGWGLGSVIAMADVMIVNEGTIEELAEKVNAATNVI